MECHIVAGNVKAFGKAIHSLAKIGIDLYIEALSEGLAIRTVNSSRSAYASIIFRKAFFETYKSGLFNDEDDPEDTIKCIIDIKSFLAIFKSLQTIEKSVERCTLKLDAYSNRIEVKLFCTHDIVHAYELVCIESNPLLAVFSKDDCRNYIVAFPKFLMNVFQSFQDEVTLSTTAGLVTLENYVEENADPVKVLHTKLHLESEEFHIYEIKEATDVTFSSKELKAALFFAELTDHPISIHFNFPGTPITFHVRHPDHFEGDFVLATLDGGTPHVDSNVSSQTMSTTSNEHSILKKAKETSTRVHQDSAHVAGSTPTERPANGIRLEDELPPSTSAGVRASRMENIQESNLVQDVLMTAFEDSNVSFAPPPHKRTRSIFDPASPFVATIPEEVILASDTDDDT